MQQSSFDFSGTAEDFSWAEQRERNERIRRDRERAEAQRERERAEEFAANERERKDARDREERERRQREQDQKYHDWFKRNQPTDPWGALGLTRSASQAEIKSAWRRLVKQHHPDTGGNAEAFRAVQAAYERLRQGK